MMDDRRRAHARLRFISPRSNSKKDVYLYIKSKLFFICFFALRHIRRSTSLPPHLIKKNKRSYLGGNKKGSTIIDWSSRERSSRGYITLEIREINTDRVYMTTVNLPPKKPIGKAEKEKRKSVKRFSIHLEFHLQVLCPSAANIIPPWSPWRHCVHSLVKWIPSHPSCRRDRIRLWCPSHSLQMMTSEKVAILPISKKDNDLI
jgi:hypothetical protein